MQMIAPGDRHVEPVAYDPKNLPERELIMELPSAVTWLVACILAVSGWMLRQVVFLQTRGLPLF